MYILFLAVESGPLCTSEILCQMSDSNCDFLKICPSSDLGELINEEKEKKGVKIPSQCLVHIKCSILVFVFFPPFNLDLSSQWD